MESFCKSFCELLNTHIVVGMMFLILATVSSHILNINDFVSGILYGVPVGVLLSGLYRNYLNKD